MDLRDVVARVEKVVCLEDRAQVERRGTFTPGPGTHRVRVENVTPLVVDRSVKVEATGARVTDARVVRIWRERPAGGLTKDASELRRQVREQEREVAAARLKVQRADGRLDRVAEAETLTLKRMAEEVGAGKKNVDRWRADLESLRREADEARAAAQDAREALREQEAKLRDAKEALARTEQPESSYLGAFELVFEVANDGPVSFSIRYLVPCAMWRPAYRATLLPGDNGEKVVIEADAVIWQHTQEAWQDVAIEVSTARPTLGTRPPDLMDDHLHLRDKSEQEKRVVDVAVREEAIQTVGEGAVRATSELPGVDDGGETRIIPVEGRSTLPSDGEPHRVRLFRVEADAKSELVAAPELSALVARVAQWTHPGPNVLLAGPVELVRESGYVGRAQLKFTAPGEKVRLGFGTEDALRVVRSVSVESAESRLTGKRTKANKVTLHVSNAGGRPVNVALEERIPKSEVKEVEIAFEPKKATALPSGVSDEGIVRFEVPLAAHEHRTVEYEWTLTAAAKVAGL